MEPVPFVPEPLTVATEALARAQTIVSDRYGEGDADELEALRVVAEIAERAATIRRTEQITQCTANDTITLPRGLTPEGRRKWIATWIEADAAINQTLDKRARD